MNARKTMAPADICHCLVVRQAGRWITQLYDQHLAGSGLSATQYTILSQLAHLGAASMAELAEAMVMDRTTVTRSVTPLERDGLVEITLAESDRRRKEVRLTPHGRATWTAARPRWKQAQAAFEKHFGAQDAETLRVLLRDVPRGRAHKRGERA
jgi:DNA-binding MarR family transcriptional regulator